MNIRLAAALSAAIVLIGVVGAPVVPVMIGATVAYGWLLWRAVASR
jgi:hypothetical protein